MPAVDVIDSIRITAESDVDTVFAEWSALDPAITVYDKLTSGYAVKLYLDWSDSGGTIPLQAGDYFTFLVPDIFKTSSIGNVTDAPIKTPQGDVVATYTIRDSGADKEVIITFTDYVETHTDISGNFWLMLYVGEVETSGTETFEFVINGESVASGGIVVDPVERDATPTDIKFGHSATADIFDGYYIFNWGVHINMSEDPVNGFNILDNFSFQDIIPQDSPHVFLTDAIRQQLNLDPEDYPLRIGEYEGADAYPADQRYALFKSHFNSIDVNLWTNHVKYYPLVDGYNKAGIDGGNGIDVSNLVVAEKSISADLGRLTRPTSIQYCTYATVKIAESALGDPEVVKLFTNTFKANYGEDITISLDIHYFGSGGTAQGIEGDYGFSFYKVDENDNPLEGVMFSLYATENLTFADRIAFSDVNGVVTFDKLPAQTYYLKESSTPQGYAVNDTVYRVILSTTDVEIYYGATFQNLLVDRKIVNRTQTEPGPVPVTLEAAKTLTGRTLESGMFSFIVRDTAGRIVATGMNDANGVIRFGQFVLDKTGIYTYTVSEVRGTYGGVTYDRSIFTVTVTVTDEGGTLVAGISYPQGGVVFNNTYTRIKKSPCPCFNTLCRTSVEGQKIWIDNNNERGLRPETIEIALLRDGAAYKTLTIDADDVASFAFCCLPIRGNNGHEYYYEISETPVPGYTTRVEGNNVINTIIPL